MMADCSAARRPASRRMSRTDGLAALDLARRLPKSVSAETSTRLFRSSASEDHFVGGRLHPEIAEMDRIVALCGQAFGQQRRQIVVDQELHAECRRGSSRSRTASAA